MAQPGELGDRELKTSYWYLTHKYLIRKIFFIGFIVVDLGLLVPAGIGLYRYIRDLAQPSILINSIKDGSINWTQVHQKIKPKSLVVTRTEKMARSTGVYDVVIWIKNPNPEWFSAQADVTVMLAGVKSTTQQIFVLPNEEKFFTVGNIRIPATTNVTQETARANVTVTNWQRLDDPKNYQLPEFNITDTVAQSLGDQYTQTRVVGNLTNRSLSGFGVVDLTVVLWSGTKALGVATSSLQNVTLNEDRSFDVRFAQMYLNVTDITVSASANNLIAENVLDR